MINDIRKTLWAAADKLRANMDTAEYKHLVLGLIFLKYVSDTFTARRTEIEARLKNPYDEFHYLDATADELEDRDYYTAANVFSRRRFASRRVELAGSRWEPFRLVRF